MGSRRASAVFAVLLASVLPAAAADTLESLGISQPALVEGPNLYTWSGPYAGGFVGYNFADFDQPAGASVDAEGLVGGVYAGYSLQQGRLVYGLEGDIGGSDVGATTFNVATGLPFGTSSGAFGSLRGRVGVAYDPFLVFATGGLAVSNQDLSLGGAGDGRTHFGYTLGAGLEARVLDNVTSRVEYRYSDFESRSYDLGNVTISSGFDEHSIRAGLALKF